MIRAGNLFCACVAGSTIGAILSILIGALPRMVP